MDDPLPYYKAVRDAGPVVWLSQSRLYAIGRYRDVRDALRNTEVFSSSRGVAANDETNRLMQGILLASDPPAHAEMRAVLGAPLLPGALKQHQERIEAAAEGLIDRLTELDRFDGMADLARFLPLTIVSRLVGLPEEGRQNMLRWASASAFDPRRNKGEHVGFGHGIHMCAGMHLARLEMQSVLKAMIPRVARIEIGKPTRVRNNIIRAFEELPARFVTVAEMKVPPRKEVSKGVWRTDTEGWLGARIVARHAEAEDIVSLELEPTDGVFPPFTAGSHVDVQVKPGLVRQYSLSSDPAFPGRYRLGILKDAKSRGGSVHVHEAFEVGREIRVGVPRNHFELSEGASSAILMAGGIGITPLLSMMYRLRAIGLGYKLHYAARSASRVAFRKELDGMFSGRVHFHTDDGSLGEKFDARTVLAQPAANTHLYVCGPAGFIDHVTSVARDMGWRDTDVHVERFGAEIDLDGDPFTVVARRSGLEVEVPPGTSIAEQLIKAGVQVPMSCQSGVCGTCLTNVVSGSPDHRDVVQTDIEKTSNARIAVCCSRSHSRILVLDI